MGESSPPTVADYAASSAQDALQKNRNLEQRVAHLEHHLRIALVAIDELRAAILR